MFELQTNFTYRITWKLLEMENVSFEMEKSLHLYVALRYFNFICFCHNLVRTFQTFIRWLIFVDSNSLIHFRWAAKHTTIVSDKKKHSSLHKNTMDSLTHQRRIRRGSRPRWRWPLWRWWKSGSRQRRILVSCLTFCMCVCDVTARTDDEWMVRRRQYLPLI